MHGNRILGKVADVLPGSRDARFDRLTLGFRPVPPDELPVVGSLAGAPDVYMAVMHSGITLAPIMGRYITQEIVHDSPVGAFALYRPGRFTPQSAQRIIPTPGLHRPRSAVGA